MQKNLQFLNFFIQKKQKTICNIADFELIICTFLFFFWNSKFKNKKSFFRTIRQRSKKEIKQVLGNHENQNVQRLNMQKAKVLENLIQYDDQILLERESLIFSNNVKGNNLILMGLLKNVMKD